MARCFLLVFPILPPRRLSARKGEIRPETGFSYLILPTYLPPLLLVNTITITIIADIALCISCVPLDNTLFFSSQELSSLAY